MQQQRQSVNYAPFLPAKVNSLHGAGEVCGSYIMGMNGRLDIFCHLIYTRST